MKLEFAGYCVLVVILKVASVFVEECLHTFVLLPCWQLFVHLLNHRTDPIRGGLFLHCYHLVRVVCMLWSI